MNESNSFSTFSIPQIDVEATSLNLKKIREDRNIKVSFIQKVFNFEYPQAIYNWENQKEKTLPRLDNLIVLAELYESYFTFLFVFRSLKQIVKNLYYLVDFFVLFVKLTITMINM